MGKELFQDMARYLHRFATDAEFSAAYNGDDTYYEPWVSYTDETEDVEYNKTEEEKQLGTPLTFEIVSAPTDMAFKWTGPAAAGMAAFSNFKSTHGELTGYPYYIEYSYNGGEWTQTTVDDVVRINGLKTGDKIQIRGNFPIYCLNPANDDYKYSFDPTTALTSQAPTFKVYGNIMSLTNPDPAVFSQMKTLYYEQDTFQTANFKNLFIRNKVTDASGLILPATTLTPYCYSHMFYNCPNLTVGPELPVGTLVDHCYWRMFDACGSLNSIRCLATDISATDCTTLWTRNTAASGTFTKASSMTSWTTGTSGIPSGWTVMNA